MCIRHGRPMVAASYLPPAGTTEVRFGGSTSPRKTSLWGRANFNAVVARYPHVTWAGEFRTEIAKPAYEPFVNHKTRGNAIAAFLLWRLDDWLWHGQHPGED